VDNFSNKIDCPDFALGTGMQFFD